MFLEGINGMSGLAVNYFYKDGLKVCSSPIRSVAPNLSKRWSKISTPRSTPGSNSDVLDFRAAQVDPATLSTIGSLTTLPWTCKPLYGFISDGYPVSTDPCQAPHPPLALARLLTPCRPRQIMGYRRKPYLFLAGVVGRFAPPHLPPRSP